MAVVVVCRGVISGWLRLTLPVGESAICLLWLNALPGVALLPVGAVTAGCVSTGTALWLGTSRASAWLTTGAAGVVRVGATTVLGRFTTGDGWLKLGE